MTRRATHGRMWRCWRAEYSAWHSLWTANPTHLKHVPPPPKSIPAYVRWRKMDWTCKIFLNLRISIPYINFCSCSLCEATDATHITKAMTALKPKSPIIFYLKLRHNSLPKLQGFVFLALDIRHLTIHNSSLAVIEETSLSSLGM